ncbi:MAG: ATP-binding protein, partial [Bacteroidales bacterium]|nr:ATP-binding protein [Bacteroidales bacterium]
KVYVVDNGFVAAKAFNLSENLGRLLENQVFVELLRSGYVPGKTLFYYWSKNNREVDFVTKKANKVEQLIQVSYSISSPKTKQREVAALTECSKELFCNDMTIVTFSESDTLNTEKGNIKVVPIMDFCR